VKNTSGGPDTDPAKAEKERNSPTAAPHRLRGANRKKELEERMPFVVID